MNYFREAVHAPWKVCNEARRVLWIPINLIHFFLTKTTIGRGWKVYGRVLIQRYGGSTIAIGSEAELRSSTTSNPLSPHHPVVLSTRTDHARIQIGNNFRMTGGTIVAAAEIVIGDNVTVGANAMILDTDFHPLSAGKRMEDFNAGQSKAVHVEDNVFIGTEALILKGVHIGEGAVIGARSVVTKDVPARTVVSGNPAKQR